MSVPLFEGLVIGGPSIVIVRKRLRQAKTALQQAVRELLLLVEGTRWRITESSPGPIETALHDPEANESDLGDTTCPLPYGVTVI